MATTTPNYGWSVPTSSDLVKNGATDIETLGDSVDASLWNSGYGQAGKNKVVNSDFSIWQRGTSFTASSAMTADRWMPVWNGGGTHTLTRETFTPGAAPVAGYEGQFFYRWNCSVATTGGTFALLRQSMEDVRTFAGQTVTISFWAKASGSVTGYAATNIQQSFGTGGSPSGAVNTFASSATVYTTSWTRYSYTVNVPSISGKTLGTNNNSSLLIQLSLPINATFTVDFYGVQIEYGTKATPYQTASGGSQEGELALCQRYLPAISGDSNTILGFAFSTTGSQISIKFPVTARAKITGITVNGTFASNYNLTNQGFTSGTPTAIAFNNGGTDYSTINVTTTAGAPTIVAGQPVQLSTLTSNGYIIFTGAEL